MNIEKVYWENVRNIQKFSLKTIHTNSSFGWYKNAIIFQEIYSKLNSLYILNSTVYGDYHFVIPIGGNQYVLVLLSMFWILSYLFFGQPWICKINISIITTEEQIPTQQLVPTNIWQKLKTITRENLRNNSCENSWLSEIALEDSRLGAKHLKLSCRRN